MGFPKCVRERPGMYVGGVTADTGLFRIFKEALDNSVDEAMNGHGTLIRIEYDTATKAFVLCDRGRGIPSGYNAKEKKTGLELALTNLHGSGKFNQENYVASAGLNGVGLKALNALSSTCVVYSANEGVWKHVAYKRGILASDGVTKKRPEHPWGEKVQGTIVEWTPDPKIFGEEVIDVERMHREIGYSSMLNPGIKFVFIVDGEKTVYMSENGLIDMVYGTDEQRSKTLGKPFQYQEEGLIDIAIAWQDDDKQVITSFVNASFTAEEGKHVEGARQAIVEALQAEIDSRSKKAPAKAPTRGKKDAADTSVIDGKYLTMGMRLAMNWRMADPIYSGQTKDKLTNAEVKTKVRNTILPQFVEFLKKNASLVSGLIERAKRFQKIDAKFTSEIQSVKSITLVDPNARGVLSGKLVQCHGYSRDEKELIFVEGDSAEGSATKARMPWQEILPLRGKIPNPMRTPTAKFLANSEVSGMFTALGVTPGSLYHESPKRRVARVGLLPDADPDGKHISSELIAFFTKYLPDWITVGAVFYINAPLYVGSYHGTKQYGNKPNEVLAKFGERERKSVLLTRLKGWGEVSVNDLHVVAMNPQSRSILKLTAEAADHAMVENIMGDDRTHIKRLLGVIEEE